MGKLLKFCKYLGTKVSNFKTKIKNSLKNIKENENLPKSKLKSALVGLTNIFTIFGRKFAAIAKDIPKPKSIPKSPVCKTPEPQ